MGGGGGRVGRAGEAGWEGGDGIGEGEWEKEEMERSEI